MIINHSMGVAEALQDIFSRQINQTGWQIKKNNPD